jgi:hypothetical protein
MSESDIEVLKYALEEIKKDIAELRAEVKCLREKIVGRLPAWATGIISVLVGIGAWFAAK